MRGWPSLVLSRGGRARMSPTTSPRSSPSSTWAPGHHRVVGRGRAASAAAPRPGPTAPANAPRGPGHQVGGGARGQHAQAARAAQAGGRAQGGDQERRGRARSRSAPLAGQQHGAPGLEPQRGAVGRRRAVAAQAHRHARLAVGDDWGDAAAADHHVGAGAMGHPRAPPGEAGDLRLVRVDAVGHPRPVRPPPAVLEVLDGPAAEGVEAEPVLVGVLGQVGVEATSRRSASSAVRRMRSGSPRTASTAPAPRGPSRRAQGRGGGPPPPRWRRGSCRRPAPPSRAAGPVLLRQRHRAPGRVETRPRGRGRPRSRRPAGRRRSPGGRRGGRSTSCTRRAPARPAPPRRRRRRPPRRAAPSAGYSVVSQSNSVLGVAGR